MALPNNFVNRVNQRNYVPTVKWDSFLSPDLHPKTRKIIISALNTYPSEQISEYTQLQFDSIIRKLLPVINKMDLMWVFTSPHWTLSRIDWVSEEPITISGTLNKSKWFGRGGMDLTDVTMYGNISIITQSSIFHGFKGDSGDVYSKVYNNDSYWGIYISQSFILNTGNGEQDIFDFTNEREIYWRQHRNTINIWEGNSFSQGFRALKNLSSSDAILGGGRVFWNMWSTQYISPSDISLLTSGLNNTINKSVDRVTRYDLTNYYRYLFTKSPVEYNQKTLLLEEGVDWESDRPVLYNRCLYFNGTPDYTFINTILIDVTNSVDIWIKPSVGFANNSNVVDSAGQGQMFRFTQLLTSNKIGWYLFTVDDYTTVGTSRTSDLTWDWDNGDWYKLTYVKERNNDNDGYILQLKVNDTVAIEYQITDVQLSGLGYSLSWNLGALASTNTNGLHYKGYIYSVTSDNGWAMMFEEGSDDTVYSNAGDEFTISNYITSARTTQDGPLLSLSGDVVGFSFIRSLTTNLAEITNTFTYPTLYTYQNSTNIFSVGRQDGYTHPSGDVSGTIINGEYIAITFNTGVNLNFSYSGISALYDKVKYKIDFIEGSRIDITYRSFTPKDTFYAWLNTEYSVAVGTIDSIANTPEKRYLMMSGTDVTHGDDYPDAVLGITGLTTAAVRAQLTVSGVIDVDDFVSEVYTAIYVNANSPTFDSLLQWQTDNTLISTMGLYDEEIPINNINVEYDYNSHIRPYFERNPTPMSPITWLILSFKVTTSGDVHYSKIYDVTLINESTAIPKKHDMNTDILYNEELNYSGRINQTMTVGGVAVELDSIQNSYLQFNKSLIAVTLSNVYGYNVNYDRQATIDDLVTDRINDRIYAYTFSNINLSRVEFTNDSVLKYNGNSTIFIDTINNYHAYVVNFVTASNPYYNDNVLYGYSDDGWTNDIKPDSHGSHTVQPGSPDDMTIVKNSEYSFSLSGVASGATRDNGQFWLQQTLLSPWRTIGNYEDWEIDFRVRNTGTRDIWFSLQAGSIPLKPNLTNGEVDEDTRLTYWGPPFDERFLIPTTQTDWINITANSLHKTVRNDSQHYLIHNYICDDGLVMDSNVGIDLEILAIRAKFGGERVDLEINAPGDVNNSGYDVFGNVLTNNPGLYVDNYQKQYIRLPEYKAEDYFLTSNENYYRQRSGYIDRLFAPFSYGHSDKGFPAYVNPNEDIWELQSGINILQDVTYKLRSLVISYTDSPNGTFIGTLNNDNIVVGLNLNSFAFRVQSNGGAIITQDTGLDLSAIGSFIFNCEFIINIGGTVNYTMQILDLVGNVLSEWINSEIISYISFDVETLICTYDNLSAIRRRLYITTPYVEFYEDGVLTHYWTYTGNNSYLLQDKVGGNHGTLTTNDVTLNQGTQNVFNPLVNGYYSLRNVLPISYSDGSAINNFIDNNYGVVSYGHPDVFGDNNAILITENDIADNPRISWFSRGGAPPMISGEKYTFSIYAKTTPEFNGQIIEIGLNGGNSITNLITLSTEWQRYSITGTITTTDNRNGIFPGLENGFPERGSGLKIYVCYLQIEKGELTDYQQSKHDIVLGSIDNYLIASKYPYDGKDSFGNDLTVDKSQQRKDIETYNAKRGIPDNLLDTD